MRCSATPAWTIEVRQDPQRLRPVDTPKIVGDCSKLRSQTGWEPQIPFEQTVQDVLDDWRQASDWVKTWQVSAPQLRQPGGSVNE